MRVIVLLLTFFISSLTALNDSPGCFRDLQSNFFDDKVVNEALGLYDIPQGTWFRINRDLRKGEKNISSRLKERTDKMRNNPLNRPFDRKVAFTLLKKELESLFSDVLFDNGVTSNSVIQNTFDYIYNQNYDRISSCYDAVL